MIDQKYLAYFDDIAERKTWFFVEMELLESEKSWIDFCIVKSVRFLSISSATMDFNLKQSKTARKYIAELCLNEIHINVL